MVEKSHIWCYFCSCCFTNILFYLRPASIAQLYICPTGDQEVAGLTPAGLATFFHEDWS